MRDRIRSYLKISVVLVTFLTISTYAYYEAGSLIKGPMIVVDYPQNGITVDSESINVSGTANNVSYINLNGRPIYTDSKGKFSEKIILSKGYNSLFIKAEDRMGKEKEETLEIMLEEKTASTTEENLAKN